MEVFTLVKAGIRSRKGIMLGFMILTMTIVVSVITMAGVRKNYESAMDKAFEIEDKGSILVFFSLNHLTDEMENNLKNDEKVDHIDIRDALVGVNVHAKDKKDGNGYIVMKDMDTVPIFDNSHKSIILPGTDEYNSRKLKKGEIYIPYGLKDKISVKENDIISMDFLGVSKDFKVKGFIQECFMGALNIGYKTVFISNEEFDEIYAVCNENISDEQVDGWALGNMVYIYPSEKADKSSDIFLRNLNIKYKLSNMAKLDMTRETAEHYAGIYIEIILAVITAFSLFLLVIFLIVAGHNISTEMEIEYANLGILMSQGFTNKLIRMVYISEYLLIEMIGIILGFIISIPLERIFSNIFFGLTAILPEKNIPISEGVIFSLLLFVITFVYISICTRRVAKVTPVKAITNARSDYYFDSGINMPIQKNALGLTLGLRQLTSNPMRYISICIVSALLIFSVITCELMSGYIQSRNALVSMGEPFTDIQFAFKNIDTRCKCEDIENIVKKYTDIEGRFYRSHIYVSVNGESLSNVVTVYPDELSSVYKGRGIKYDNEIVVTEQVCRLLDVELGDTVQVGRNKFAEDYVIVGIFQTMNDTGKSISMSLDGLSRLKENPEDKYDPEDVNMHGIVLKDPKAGQKIENEIKEKYGDEVEVKYLDYDKEIGEFGDTFYLAAEGSQILIYTLVFIFALITVAMVCTKAFIQERTDIGIFRAIGFGVGNVRSQFASRFMIISIFSSVIGAILSRLYSGKVLGSLFSLFGIPHIEMEYEPMLFIRPIIIFVIGYFIFGYIAARKVKKVNSRELITE